MERFDFDYIWHEFEEDVEELEEEDGWVALPVYPAYPAFYVGKPVVTDASQLKPGVRVAEYCGCCDPVSCGQVFKVTSKPYKYSISGHYIGVFIDMMCDGKFSRESLADHGVMLAGETPYNQNRWILVV